MHKIEAVIKSNRLIYSMIACAICPAAAIADGAWRDAASRASLENDALRADFQSGILYRLTSKASGEPLMSGDPATLQAEVPIFGDSGINLDDCTVAHRFTERAVVGLFRTPDGG